MKHSKIKNSMSVRTLLRGSISGSLTTRQRMNHVQLTQKTTSQRNSWSQEKVNYLSGSMTDREGTSTMMISPWWGKTRRSSTIDQLYSTSWSNSMNINARIQMKIHRLRHTWGNTSLILTIHNSLTRTKCSEQPPIHQTLESIASSII